MDRIDTILVQPIVTTYDTDGKPLHEANGQPLKLFRASQPDVWALLDAMLAETVTKTTVSAAPTPAEVDAPHA